MSCDLAPDQLVAKGKICLDAINEIVDGKVDDGVVELLKKKCLKLVEFD